MNTYIEQEQKVQSDFWFTYKTINFFAGLLIFLLGSNDNLVFAFFLGVIQIGLNAWYAPSKLDEFADRMKQVVFKTQVDNLYVFSEYGQKDASVAETFQSVVQYLKQVDNKHEVRVNMIIFRDVQIFTWWWDVKGNLQKSSKPRPALSSSETWEQYQEAVNLFKKIDTDERLRELRKDAQGFDWVNENVFNQCHTN